MTVKEARSIGSRQGLIGVAMGLLTAQAILTVLFAADGAILEGFVWIAKVDFKHNILIGVLLLVINGHFYGQLAGYLVLIRKWQYAVAGILCSLGALISTAFLSGFTGFFEEGLDDIGTLFDPFEDYIVKPLYWITLFGSLPAVLIGINMGWRILRNGNMRQAIA